MWGKTEQVQTTGVNLFNEREVVEGLLQSDGSIDKSDNPFITSGYIPVASGRKYTRTEKYSGNFYYDAEKNFVSKDSKGKNVSVPEGCHYLRVSYGKSDKNIMINEGEELKSYEPYSGGFPSPSPDWEQPIEVTDHPVTVTIKGGTEQKLVTLVPPRPLTKWDKLEKVDGVWMWMYQSKACMLSDIATEWAYYQIDGLKQYYFVCKDCYYEKNKNNIYADRFKSWTVEKRQNNYGTVYLGNEAICFNVDKFSLESWKSWVSANPVELLYKTKENEYVPLTAKEQSKLNALTMCAGTTEIINNGGCQMELTYTVDTKSYVDSKIAENSKNII